MRGYILGGVALAALSTFSSSVRAADVVAGFDLLKTLDQTQDFASTPIPPNFFGPGSDPFTGIVTFMGEPMTSFPPCGLIPLGMTDTIIERLANASLPFVGSNDIVPIEIVQLHLVSVNPIVVTYGGGGSPEDWQVHVEVSPVQPSLGTMNIIHSLPSGGIFNAQFRVYPRFTFIRPSDNATVVRDFGALGQFNNYTASGGSWSYNAEPLGCLSCNETNFFPGIHQFATTVSWHCSAPNAVHDFLPPCPTVPVSNEESTWGAMKAIYR